MKLYISEATLRTIEKFGNASLTHISSVRSDHMSVELDVARTATDNGGGRDAALMEASALCQAIANGYVSDVNPKRSREAADAAIFCAREIAALSQKAGEKG